MDPLCRDLLVRIVEEAGKRPIFHAVPLCPASEAGAALRCPMCLTELFVKESPPPMKFHAKHVSCASCAGKFRNCPICRSSEIDPKPIEEAEFKECLELMNGEQLFRSLPVKPTADTVLINLNLFSEEHNQGYGHQDRWAMMRGLRPYYCPYSWKRIGLNVPGFDQMYASWPVAYHGTCSKNVLSIIQYGLLNPGAETELGEKIKSINGRAYCEPGQNPIYATQSIEYASLYSKHFQLEKGYVQAVLQLRVRPECYQVNSLTFAPTQWPPGAQFDDFFSNEEIEWRIENPADVHIYGIMLRVTEKTPYENFLERRARVLSGVPPQLSARWEWYCNNPGREGYVAYSPSIQLLIETAYARGDKQVFFHLGAKQDMKMYYIDFASMAQFRFDNTSLWRGVQRIPFCPVPPK
jgi:hypothetical protein